jgi:hypothetical protein
MFGVEWVFGVFAIYKVFSHSLQYLYHPPFEMASIILILKMETEAEVKLFTLTHTRPSVSNPTHSS